MAAKRRKPKQRPDTEVINLPNRIDIRHEKPYPMREIGSVLPTRWSRRQSYIYTDQGMRHRENRNVRIRLETVLIGGLKHSTIEAYHRLVDAVNMPLKSLRKQLAEAHSNGQKEEGK